MFKRSMVLFTVIFLVLSIDLGLSENKEIAFVYSKKDKEYSILWGGNVSQFKSYSIGTLWEKSFKLSKLPLLSDPINKTSDENCFSAKAKPSNIKFCDIDIPEVELFFYAPYNENGALDITLTQFCLAKMTVDSRLSQNEFNKIISNLSNQFGKPKKNEKILSEEQAIVIGYPTNQLINYKISNLTYTWNGTNGTRLLLNAEYNNYLKVYEKAVIYLGPTTTNNTLNNKKAGNPFSINNHFAHSPSQLTVENKRIALRDENNKIIQKLEVGTELLIIGYDKNLDMFAAIVVDGSSNAEEKAAKGAFDGYVHGDNLSVSRAELLEKYKD